MKKLITLTTLTALTCLISCGRHKTNPSVITPPPVIILNESILNKWVALDDAPLHGITELDYSLYSMGVELEDQFCDGSLGNAGLVNGVSENHSMISGALDHGFIQFGHLSYVNASIPQCRDLSKERYEFRINGKIMRLCMVNYPYCADYKLVE